jgi:hypothetical protein
MTQAAQKIQLDWGMCRPNRWCPLNTVDLDHEAFGTGGVYVIWHGGTPARTVRVGQAAVIRERLAIHRDDPEIQAYQRQGTLYVTWARASARQRDGIERYLSEQLQPLVGERYPDVAPIAVNLPWD